MPHCILTLSLYEEKMVEPKALVISDNLAHAISNSALEISGEEDIVFGGWEAYLDHTFEQSVVVFDLNLFKHASKKRNTDIWQISEKKQRFKSLFEVFARTLRVHLQMGDSVVILDSTSLDVTINNFTGPSEQASSHQWVSELGIINSRHYITDWVPEITTEIETASDYLQAVTNHYSYELNPGVVRDPEVLARSPDTGDAAAFATNEIMNENGKRTEVDGTLLFLSQPAVVNKPFQLMELLVNTGWHFHEEDRTDQIQKNAPETKTTLSIPMGELDEDLVEKCWSKYARGEYRDAASRACQLLEHRVRETVGDGDNDRSGASLMKHAFSQNGGPLSMGEKPGEKEGVMHLYAGAIQGIWNPLHHRPSGEDGKKYLDDFGQQEAHDVISYVNFLLSRLPEGSKEE